MNGEMRIAALKELLQSEGVGGTLSLLAETLERQKPRRANRQVAAELRQLARQDKTTLGKLVAASESALRVLVEICDPTLTHMPDDETVRDDLRTALEPFAGKLY